MAGALGHSLLTSAIGAGLGMMVGLIITAFTPSPLWMWVTANREMPFPYNLSRADYGALSGAVWGMALGLVIFCAATFDQMQTHGGLPAPPKSLRARVVLGQCAGVCGLLLFYFSLIFGASQIQNQPFTALFNFYSEWLLRAMPALMICGAIAGALSARPARAEVASECGLKHSRPAEIVN